MTVNKGDRFCKTVGYVAQAKSISMKLLLERLKRNEDTTQSTLLISKDLWRKTRKASIDLGGRDNSALAKKNVRKMRVDQMQALYEKSELEKSEESKSRYSTPYEVFQAIARRVRLLMRVFRNIRRYAIEKGGHGNITTGAMQLKDTVVNDEDQKNLLFNANDYKCKHQFSIPYWARMTCTKEPEHRKRSEVSSIVSLMRQLKAFRKYSNRMQILLANIVRYERFGRRRVVIRKGHIGMSFYFIFSGSVGVVVEGDEDKAFVDEEKPANVLQKGDAFGEIALVRRSVRSATIVCLETTEFMVIDKEDFYRLGIDKCTQEEMIFRYNFMKNLSLFSTWNEEDLKDVAEGGRNIQYLTDQVIEADTTETEFIYIITKGKCTVLRLLDLTYFNQEERKLKRENTKSPAMSSGYSGSLPSVSQTSKHNPSNQLVMAVYNARSKTFKKSVPQNKEFENRSVSSFDSVLSKTSKTSKLSLPKLTSPDTMPVIIGNFGSPERYLEKPGRYLEQADVGLGVLIQVDLLEKGQAFGLESILYDDDHDENGRKFSLVSAGCDVIRVPKSVLKHYADPVMLEKIRQTTTVYDSDKSLYQRFKKYNNWRCFREQLVDHIALCETRMQNSLKQRCKLVPKAIKLNDVTSLGRPETPIEHWERLAEDGYITRASPLNSPPKYDVMSPTSSMRESEVDYHSTFDQKKMLTSNKVPFQQNKILTANGSHRRLVLTHGGSRVNRLQMETKCSLIKTRQTIRNRIIL